MPLRAELDARHDHRAVLANETVDERHRVDRVLVAEEADRTGGRRRPMEHRRVTRTAWPARWWCSPLSRGPPRCARAAPRSIPHEGPEVRRLSTARPSPG